MFGPGVGGTVGDGDGDGVGDGAKNVSVELGGVTWAPVLIGFVGDAIATELVAFGAADRCCPPHDATTVITMATAVIDDQWISVVVSIWPSYSLP